ncbi:MAG: phosphatase PAP2 family protein [Ignavibacteriales bacterium]|nr:phosphatase PAP2 family protein [Ignavibacteriales bacterium]
MKKIARIISTVFIPPIMVFVTFTFLSFYLETNGMKIFYGVLSSFILGVLLPIIYFIKLRKQNRIKDNDATIKEERTNPYLYGIFLCLIGLFFFAMIEMNKLSFLLWFCYIINSLFMLLINKFWKISAHSIGISIPFAVLIFLFKWWGLLFLPFVFLVAWSRLKLKVHTPLQVIAGVLFGFILTIIQISIFI